MNAETSSVTSTSSSAAAAASEVLKAKAAAATAAMKAKMEAELKAKQEKQAAKEAEKAAAKAAKEAEKEAAKAAAAAEKEAAKAAKAAEKEASKAAAAAEKASQPRRPVGRPKKVKADGSSASSTVSESAAAPVLTDVSHLVAAAPAAPEAAVEPAERIKQLEDEVAELRTFIAALQATHANSLAALEGIRKLVTA